MPLNLFARAGRAAAPADMPYLESLVIPAFVLDSEGKVILWNAAVEQLTGLARAEVMGTREHWRAFYDHKRPCLADLLFDDRASSGDLYVAQNALGVNSRSRTAETWCNMPRRGERRYLMIDASAILDDAGRLVAVVETLRDTTSEQNGKAALETQRAAQDQAVAAQLEEACSAMATALAALAGGDLTYRIKTPLPAAVDRLRQSFNEAIERLDMVVGQTTATADVVCRGNEDISASAEELSARTERQAAALTQTSAALKQIMATVRQTAEGATRARGVVAATREDTDRSGKIVRDAVAAMDQVERSSRQVKQILGVIDEIAFQTNLLALNAGVEAARAGDVGRGFAVVAAEVRALAQRSAESAREINKLMLESTGHVEQGVALVAQAGQALTRIVGQISEIDDVVADFSRSAQEQATGLGEIDIAVSQMDGATQQNAAMVQNTTTTCRDLLEETAELAARLRRFKVDDEAAMPVARREPDRAPPARAVRRA